MIVIGSLSVDTRSDTLVTGKFIGTKRSLAVSALTGAANGSKARAWFPALAQGQGGRDNARA